MDSHDCTHKLGPSTLTNLPKGKIALNPKTQFRSPAGANPRRIVFSVIVLGSQELQEIIRAPRLGADAGHLEAAEGLAMDQRSRDLAIDVQIADAKLRFDAANVLRAA